MAIDLNALHSDLKATCANIFEVSGNEHTLYTDQPCLDSLAQLLPGLKFTGHVVQIPAHAGYISQANLTITSYQPALVNVPARMKELAPESCLKKIMTADEAVKTRALSRYRMEELLRDQPDLSRTLVLKLNPAVVKDWKDFGNCADSVAARLPEYGMGKLATGTPYVVNGELPYMVIRLFK